MGVVSDFLHYKNRVPNSTPSTGYLKQSFLYYRKNNIYSESLPISTFNFSGIFSGVFDFIDLAKMYRERRVLFSENYPNIRLVKDFRSYYFDLARRSRFDLNLLPVDGLRSAVDSYDFAKMPEIKNFGKGSNLDWFELNRLYAEEYARISKKRIDVISFERFDDRGYMYSDYNKVLGYFFLNVTPSNLLYNVRQPLNFKKKVGDKFHDYRADVGYLEFLQPNLPLY